jgi:GNAT superfamily N-acetyltransferase
MRGSCLAAAGRKVSSMTDHSRPLSERVDAPDQLPGLGHPDVALWRAATEADIDGIWQLDRETGMVDHPHYLATRDEIAEDFGFSHFHPETDSIVGLDAEGRIIANGMSMFPPGQETLVRVVLFGGVHPSLRGRGIGRQVLAWQMARARQQLASSTKVLPGWILARTVEQARQNARLFERAGLKLARYFLRLERDLRDPAPSIQLAPDVRLDTYRPELADVVHAARDEVFLDHWGSQPVSDQMWASFVGADTFRKDLSFVVFGTDAGGEERVIGFLLSTVNEDDWARQGFSGSYIDLVGVRAGWRGRHVAQALLAAQVQAGRALGHERVTLDVDAESRTGALALYTGMGFHPTHRELAYTLAF